MFRVTAAERAAIQSVFQQHAGTKALAEEPFKRRMHSTFDLQRERLKLCQQIDASHCPSQFRAAWWDYLQLWEKELNPNLFDLLKTGSKLAELSEGNFIPLLKDYGKPTSSDAWQRVRRAAFELGVTPP